MVKKMTVGQSSLKLAVTLSVIFLPEVHYWMHTYFTKHPRLTVSLRVQIHVTPHHLARTEDLVGPMLSWLLNIAFYSCELALASGILRGF